MRVSAAWPGLAVALAVAAGCATSGVSHVRFANQPPVWQVNDRQDVPQKPEERKFSHLLYFFDAFFFRQLTESMELEEPRTALNINSLGEVPDSTWFTNRIGHHPVTPAAIAAGPNTGGDPQLPLTVTGSKVGGKSVGFIAKDARGDKFIVKFDEAGYPILETAADVIVQRILWACGYNVPQDAIVYFRRDQLILASDAEVKDTFGNARPMTTKDLDDSLALVNRGSDGRYRALASKFLPGIPIGGFAMRGVRSDDVNDTIPHEHRREIRGLRVIYTWLQATDVKEDNTLDVWAVDPANESVHYVVHYLVDFGKSLGVNATIPGYEPDGHAARVDLAAWGTSLVTLGAYRRPWEGAYAPNIEGVAHFDVEHINPSGYNPQQPYRPFEFADRLDNYWAAKIVARFGDDLIRTAVEQGKFDDPRAVEYLSTVLAGRRDRLVRFWFRRVSPLDNFALGPDRRLCFDDLMIVHELDPLRTAKSSWSAAAFDYSGRPLGWSQAARPDATKTACVSGFPLGGDREQYTILRLRAQRHDRPLPAVEVHLAASAGGLRIIGIHRD